MTADQVPDVARGVDEPARGERVVGRFEVRLLVQRERLRLRVTDRAWLRSRRRGAPVTRAPDDAEGRGHSDRHQQRRSKHGSGQTMIWTCSPPRLGGRPVVSKPGTARPGRPRPEPGSAPTCADGRRARRTARRSRRSPRPRPASAPPAQRRTTEEESAHGGEHVGHSTTKMTGCSVTSMNCSGVRIILRMLRPAKARLCLTNRWTWDSCCGCGIGVVSAAPVGCPGRRWAPRRR